MGRAWLGHGRDGFDHRAGGFGHGGDRFDRGADEFGHGGDRFGHRADGGVLRSSVKRTNPTDIRKDSDMAGMASDMAGMDSDMAGIVSTIGRMGADMAGIASTIGRGDLRSSRPLPGDYEAGRVKVAAG